MSTLISNILNLLELAIGVYGTYFFTEVVGLPYPVAGLLTILLTVYVRLCASSFRNRG